MPIPRAGPYASSTDSFIDDPALDALSERPVNCADYTGSVNWFWNYYYITSTLSAVFEERSADQDATSVTEDFSWDDAITSTFDNQGIQFAYQAAQDVEFTGSYSLDADSNPQAYIHFSVLATVSSRTSYDFLLYDSAVNTPGDPSPSISGNFNVTLPATTLPRFVFLRIWSYTPATGSITINLTPSS
jgi:hypothetical protein